MSLTCKTLSLPLSDWDSTVGGFEDRTLFQTAEWISFVRDTQAAQPIFVSLQDGGQTRGYFTGLIIRRFGLNILGSPLPGWTTSYMGMNLLPGVSRRLGLDAILRFVFEDLKCVHVELMDRYVSAADAEALGLEMRMFEGFEVDLAVSERQLFANMSSACRRCVRRAEKCGVRIEEGDDGGFASDYYLQLCDVFRKQSRVPPYNMERVRTMIDHLANTRHLLLLRARDPSGRCIATGIFPAMNGTMYFWGGASRRDALHYRPNEAIQWHAMRFWRSRGIRRYDMGGGGHYKRKYGGYEIAVPWIRKSKYPGLRWLREMARLSAGLRQCMLAIPH